MNATNDRYCRLAANTISCNSRVIVTSDLLENCQVLDSETARIFLRANGFKTLERHASEYTSRPSRLYSDGQPTKSSEEVRGTLQELASSGLLIPEAEWLRAASSDTGSDLNVEGKISSLAVVTKDRPGYVLNTVARLIGELIGHEPPCQICIYDDSHDFATLNAVKTVCGSKAGNATRIAYGGPTEKRQYIDRLKNAGLPVHVLEFAVLPRFRGLDTYGANLNCVLLDSIGSMAIAIDDDIVCLPMEKPGRADGLRLCSDPVEVTVCCDRRRAVAELTRSAMDIVAVHERLLGRSVRGCISEAIGSAGVEVSDIGPLLMTELLKNSGRVMATMMGSAGDAGTSSNWCRLAGASRHDLRMRAESDSTILESHEVIRVASRPSITDNQWFMSYACGLDNRRLLPPFLPVCRNQDGVWGEVLRLCWHHHYIGHLPWIVVHDAPVRNWRHNWHIGPRISELVIMALRALRGHLHSSDPLANLRAVGQHLMYLGTLSKKEFHSWLRTYYYAYLVGERAQVESLLGNDPVKSATWETYCRSYLSALDRTLEISSEVAPADIAAQTGADESLTITQQIIVKYGELLMWWPEVMAFTAEHNSPDEKIAIGVK